LFPDTQHADLHVDIQTPSEQHSGPLKATCAGADQISWPLLTLADVEVAEMAHKMSDLLSQLILVPPPTLSEALQHQAELKPITWAAQICAGIVAQDRAVLAPLPDSMWRPTCLSIGPVPMASAGAESVCNLTASMRLRPHKVHPDDVFGCLRLTVTLTTLARRMAQEAAGAWRVHGDEQHIHPDVSVVACAAYAESHSKLLRP
jgi:hypothetical protein